MIQFILLTITFGFALVVYADQKTDEIDKQISQLKKELHQDQLLEMKQEVDGQGLMMADWPAYGQEVLKTRQVELKNIELQKKIDALETRKKALLQQQSSP